MPKLDIVPVEPSNQVDTIDTCFKLDDSLPVEEQIAYLHLIKNLKLTEIASIIGLTQPTVSWHLKRWRQKPENLRTIYNYWTKEISSQLMHKSLACLQTLDPEKIPHGQRMTTAAIAIDKLRLLQGDSTHNVSQHVVVERLHSAKQSLQALAKRANLTEEELRRRALEMDDHIIESKYDPKSNLTKHDDT